MENLKYPKVMSLYNDMDSKNLVKVAGKNELQLLDRGLLFDGNTTIEVLKTHLGHKTGYFVSLNLNGPATTGVRYDALFSVRVNEMRPGIGNQNPIHNLNSTPIAGFVNNPVVNSGVISANTELLMLRALMDSIVKAKKSSNSYYFDGRAGYYVRIDDTGAVLTINGNGTTATAANTAVDLADKVNAVSGIIAVPVKGDVVFVTSETPNIDFTLVATTKATLLEQGVYITGTNSEEKADILADPNLFKVKSQSLISIDISGAATNAEAQMSFFARKADSTLLSYSISDKTAANVVSGINGGAVSSVIMAYAIGNIIMVAGVYNATSKLVKITTSIESVVFFGLFDSVEKGMFPVLTADLLFEEFAGFYNGIGAMVRQNQTIKGAQYVSLLIVQSLKEPAASGGASTFVEKKTRHQLVIEKNIFFGKDSWNTTMTDAGTTKNLANVINAGPWGSSTIV